jgi:hypothetical protein
LLGVGPPARDSAAKAAVAVTRRRNVLRVTRTAVETGGAVPRGEAVRLFCGGDGAGDDGGGGMAVLRNLLGSARQR